MAQSDSAILATPASPNGVTTLGPSKSNGNGNLKAPPPQEVHGVILYHSDPAIDDRIREVRSLREEYGFDVSYIAQAVRVSRAQAFAYLKQIRLARKAYMAAFPEDFISGMEAMVTAIEQRREMDTMLRRELGKSSGDNNPSNRVGLYKLIMRNMRELEELCGLLVNRIEHGGEIAINDMKTALDQAPAPLREAYLDALAAVVHATAPAANQGPGS